MYTYLGYRSSIPQTYEEIKLGVKVGNIWKVKKTRIQEGSSIKQIMDLYGMVWYGMVWYLQIINSELSQVVSTWHTRAINQELQAVQKDMARYAILQKSKPRKQIYTVYLCICKLRPTDK